MSTAAVKTVKNVVFDIGNVMVKWSPAEIVRKTFGEDADQEYYVNAIFQDKLWYALNRGEVTEDEAKARYREALNLTDEQADLLFHHIKDSQDVLDGSVELLQQLHEAGYPLFALTDNVKEIVWYLKRRYDFWKYFQGVVVSAEVNCLKPDPEIFYHLLESNGIRASETVFLDDMPANVQGARDVGMEAIQFHCADKCTDELKEIGLTF